MQLRLERSGRGFFFIFYFAIIFVHLQLFFVSHGLPLLAHSMAE